jgi:hypothetical protein
VGTPRSAGQGLRGTWPPSGLRGVLDAPAREPIVSTAGKAGMSGQDRPPNEDPASTTLRTRPNAGQMPSGQRKHSALRGRVRGWHTAARTPWPSSPPMPGTADQEFRHAGSCM